MRSSVVNRVALIKRVELTKGRYFGGKMMPNAVTGRERACGEGRKYVLSTISGLRDSQGHRKVDEAVKILLTANSGEERLTMKSGFFESAPVGS